MKVLYSNEAMCDKDVGPSIFLAGPTPRSTDVPSWRPEALEILKDFDGTVLIPEYKVGTQYDYVNQVAWERAGLLYSSAIIVWVPRCMTTMPALTTNIEFGYWLAKSPDRLLYGRPENAPHTAYLDWLYNLDTGRQPMSNLEVLLKHAVKQIVAEETLRRNGQLKDYFS